MNELGMSLAWLAIQVTLFGLPSLALHTLATRRGPTSGAWVAGLCLGMVVVLSLSVWISGPGHGGGMLVSAGARLVSARVAGPTSPPPPVANAKGRDDLLDRSRPSFRTGWGLAELRLAWAQFERGAVEPVVRTRPWGQVLAVVALAGTGLGLLRLVIGLWGVRVWRRTGRAVDDPAMRGLFDELRKAMGCASTIAIYEVNDLTTPATAGWWRPTVLLPANWRSWSGPERRAVLAHELAHIVRGDYAIGLLGQLAVALNYYHPVVRWIAGQLLLQQEQAADALGARFAGGRTSYLVALSRLALEQDGRSPHWPARKFLPGRGTLIRRIAMLRDRNETGAWDRPLSRGSRLLTTFLLVGLTMGVATLRGPARGGEGEAPARAAAPAQPRETRAIATPITPCYVGDGMLGLVAFRPAATFRRIDFNRIAPLLAQLGGVDFAAFPKEYQAVTSKPGALRLDVTDIEWVTFGLGFGHLKNDQGDALHSLVLGGLTIRAIAPFDWLTFLRQWRFGFDEARHDGRVYYKLTGPLKEVLGPSPCVCLLDDRTVIFDEEKAIRLFLSRDSSQPPAYLRTPDWERASQGLLAVALNNDNGVFAKRYDLGRPDDAVFLSLFKDVDHWTIGVDDAESIVLHATATCRAGDGEASQAIARVVHSLLKLAREGINDPGPETRTAGTRERAERMIRTLLANLQVEPVGGSVELRTEGFGTLVELGSILRAEADEWSARDKGAPAEPTRPRR